MNNKPPAIPVRKVRETTSSAIYSYLRDEIISMRLRPGEVLREKEIAELFGSSRTPVREACLRLTKENLLDVRPQSGTFVEPIKLSRIWDAQFLRVSVEVAAVQKLAPMIDQTTSDWLVENMLDLGRAADRKDNAKFNRVDEEFHAGLVSAAGHGGVWKLVNDAKAHLDRVRSLMIPRDDHMLTVVSEHQAIVEALMARDLTKAKVAMKAHLDPLPDFVAMLVENSPDLFVIDAEL